MPAAMRRRALGTLVAAALAAAALTALVAGVAGATGTPKPGGRPYTVASSAVTQSGGSVVWSVKLTAPFSPAAMHKAKRSLCLLLERPANGRVFADLCVIGPRSGGKHPRIVYQPVTHGVPGHATVIDATVTRPSTRTLTASFAPSAYGGTWTPVGWQVRTTLRPPGCTPAGANPLGCLSLFPAKPSLAKLHTPQLVGCTPTGPVYVTNGSRSVHEIALTFDDGPWYDTPQFLSVLEHAKVPATFFEIGDQVSTYGQGGAVERRMLADGDMIGDHTWNHPDVSRGGSFAAGEIAEAAHAIKVATHGFEPCLFRAPYGAVSNALTSEARSMGFTTIEWDVDPTDWARPGTGAIYSRVTSMAHNGSIILQHDGGGDRSETLAALPQEIQTFKREGYKFVTVTDLLGYKLLYK
jgi:peptidoglycan/xylan/chitin deacetylase (PgdA/CDA1 family)